MCQQVDSKAAELNLSGVAASHVGIAHTRFEQQMLINNTNNNETKTKHQLILYPPQVGHPWGTFRYQLPSSQGKDAADKNAEQMSAED